MPPGAAKAAPQPPGSRISESMQPIRTRRCNARGYRPAGGHQRATTTNGSPPRSLTAMNSSSKTSQQGHAHAGMPLDTAAPRAHTQHDHAPPTGSGGEAEISARSQADAPQRDPVCGMAVTAESEHRSAHQGNTYRFCSPGCKRAFDAEPARYAGDRAGAGTAHHSPHHRASTTTAAPPPSPAAPGTIYTCPMHPEIRQDHPGNCPKCGMTLERLLPELEDDNPELRDFSRRFWTTLPLTLVVLALAMLGDPLHLMDMATQSWVELVLSLPIVLWAGGPFFSRGWLSVVNRSPNMWTLIGLGRGPPSSTASWPPLRQVHFQHPSCPWDGSVCISRPPQSSSR